MASLLFLSFVAVFCMTQTGAEDLRNLQKRCINCGQNSPVNVNTGVQSGKTGGVFGTPAGQSSSGTITAGDVAGASSDVAAAVNGANADMDAANAEIAAALTATPATAGGAAVNDSNNGVPMNINTGTQKGNVGAVFG